MNSWKTVVDVPWSFNDALRALVALLVFSLLLLGLMRIWFGDGSTPLIAVLLSALLLNAAMWGFVFEFGLNRRSQLLLLFGPNRLVTSHLGFWSFATLLCNLFLMIVFFSLLDRVASQLVPPPLPFALEGDGTRMLGFFVVVLIGPITEEVFFRGFVFPACLKRYGRHRAVVLSAIAFGIAHGDPSLFGPAFLAGCVFAYVYYRTGSLWPTILAHTAQNAIAFAMLG